MTIAVPKEIKKGEKRVAIIPDTASKLIEAGFQVSVEKDAGIEAGYTDQQYENAGAKLFDKVEEMYSSADVVLKVQRPMNHPDLNKHESDMIKQGTLLISFMYSLNNPQDTKQCADKGIDVIGMEAIPRTTLAQKMDALSSQANLAGYKSVVMTANELRKIFPLMMTAAGTISPAKVVIMGAGVAGLQAIGTARRLGAVVYVSDIRPQVKEEVESLGGKFIEVETDESMQEDTGYAKEASEEFLKRQQEQIYKRVTDADIVITTALVPGKKAPVLVTEEMIKNMRPGSVILDMAVEFGGNVELSQIDQTIEKHNVKIIGESNLPSLVAYHASEMYSKNMFNLLKHISKDGQVELNMEDEIVKGCLLARNSEVIHEKTKELLSN